MDSESKPYEPKLEQVLGTKGKVRILCYLAENYPHDYPLSEISRQIGLSKRATNVNLEELTKQGMTSSRTIGNRIFYTLANENLCSAVMHMENNLKEILQASTSAKPTS